MNGDKYRKTYKVCESMSKRMVIVKLWVNSDKHRKIECLWSNEEMIDDIVLQCFSKLISLKYCLTKTHISINYNYSSESFIFRKIC
jgi:hypothetical protein